MGGGEKCDKREKEKRKPGFVNLETGRRGEGKRRRFRGDGSEGGD